MVIVIVRDKNRIKLLLADLFVIETHGGKGITVATEGIFEERIKNNARAITFENGTRMQDAGDGQRWTLRHGANLEAEFTFCHAKKAFPLKKCHFTGL